jgi:hypothetical protein
MLIEIEADAFGGAGSVAAPAPLVKEKKQVAATPKPAASKPAAKTVSRAAVKAKAAKPKRKR